MAFFSNATFFFKKETKQKSGAGCILRQQILLLLPIYI